MANMITGACSAPNECMHRFERIYLLIDRMKETSKKPASEAKASSQTARAVLSLREMLVQGRFRPGERIREVPLAADLKISRIPLHLALERLAHEGFLEIRPTRGFV